MSKKYTLEDMKIAMSVGFYAGVDAGEIGIPENYVTYLPEHMNWYCEKSVEFQNEFWKEADIINGEIIRKK